MWGRTIIGGFSIGFFYLPAAIMKLVAACVEGSAKRRDALQ
jgi:hypothetical protein